MSWDAVSTGRRGRQQSYSDAAIQTCLSMKVLFGMALRQTTGFVESLLQLVGLNWTVPGFSTLSRRQKTLAVTTCPAPKAPSFITRVCGIGFHIRRFRFGQARRARSPEIAQAQGALQRVFGCPEMSAV
jgi:hypothetical protein